MPDAKRFVPEIVRLTRDKEASVRIEAALTLGYLKPAEAVPVGPLNDLLGDSVPEVRITALESLERIPPERHWNPQLNDCGKTRRNQSGKQPNKRGNIWGRSRG